jgi:hypothetical protein
VHTALLAMAIAAPAVMLRLVEGNVGAEKRLHPALVTIADAAPFLLLGSVLHLVWRLAREAAWTVKHRGMAFRAAYFVGSVLLQTVLVGALSVTVVISSPDWLFGPRLVTSAASPTDARVAYLYGGGLFCGYSVYYGRPGSPLIERAASGSAGCDDVGRARLRWRDGTAEVVDAAGLPLPAGTPLSLPIWGGC